MTLVNNSCCSLLNKRSAFWERLLSFKNCIWSNKPNYRIIKYVINVNKYQMGCKTFNFRSVQIDWDKHCCGILSVPSKAQKRIPTSCLHPGGFYLRASFSLKSWSIYPHLLHVIALSDTVWLGFKAWRCKPGRLLEARRYSWGRSVIVPRHRHWGGNGAAFCTVGSGLISRVIFPRRRGRLLLSVPAPASPGWM